MIILLQRLANLLNNPQSRGTFGEMIVKSIFDPRFFGDKELTSEQMKEIYGSLTTYKEDSQFVEPKHND